MFAKKEKIRLLLPSAILGCIVKYADGLFPKETGGCLMGYMGGSEDIIVTHIVKGGPRATNTKNSFVPDYEFQEKEIERIYFETNRTSTYLGDWHTHPKGQKILSSTDINTLYNISRYRRARARFPVMMLLAGKKESWNLRLWQLWRKKIMEIELVIVN